MLSHQKVIISESAVSSSLLELRSQVENDIHNQSEAEFKMRLRILEQLKEFELGRFLLVNRGLNGYWTDEILNRPVESNRKEQYTNSLEEYLFEESPTFAARREAQRTIHNEVSPKLRPGSTVASFPSGLMSEVLLAKTERFSGVEVFAIDLDAENFALIRERYGDRLVGNTFHMLQMDARHLDFCDHFDLICSTGLTFYMSSDDEVQQLLNRFYVALKPKGGKLVTTFGASPKEYSSHLAKLPRTYLALSTNKL